MKSVSLWLLPIVLGWGVLRYLTLTFGWDWRTWAAPEAGGWTFFGRALWDWLELLVVPVVLALGAIWFQRRERETERQIAKDRDEERALETYLGRMGELLEKGLKEALPIIPDINWTPDELKIAEERRERTRDVLIDIARTYTMTILRRLDGDTNKGAQRKGAVVEFLQEAGLIGGVKNDELEPRGKVADEDDKTKFFDPVVILIGANLTSANLQDVVLAGARLEWVKFEEAILIGDDLKYANLRFADLRSANLSKANLACADLSGAILEKAVLRGAILKEATMPDGEKWAPEMDISKFGAIGTPQILETA